MDQNQKQGGRFDAFINAGKKQAFVKKNILKVFANPDTILYDQEVVEQFWKENEIRVDGKNVKIPQPYLEWKDCQFNEPIMKRIQLKQYTKPTPIQSQVLPIIMAGHDLIGIAQTGSGKTLAFLLPGLVHLNAQADKNGPVMVILVPTRELAMQIHGNFFINQNKKLDHVKHFCDAYDFRSACIYGGTDKGPQEWAMKKGVEIIVATPGRLIDFIKSEVIGLERTTFLVLDEADRMLDMGFEPQVRFISDQIRQDRQTVFFSATWPRAVQNLACDLCHNEPVNLYLGEDDIIMNKNISQEFICLNEDQKLGELISKLDKLTIKDKVLVFVETKRDCEDLSQQLTREGFFCLALHGDKTQKERDQVMREFKSSKCRIVCATDVASRGLDVRDITLVINYDLPNQIDNYIHRIGRTGRAGDKGKSISLITYGVDDQKIVREIVDMLKDNDLPIPNDLYDFVQSRSYQKGKLKKSYSNQPPPLPQFQKSESAPQQYYKKRMGQ